MAATMKNSKAKLSLALVALGLISVCALAHAEDASVYAEVSSVEELRAAVSKLKPVGGAIYLKSGTYVIKEPVVTNGNFISFFGAGIDKTIIKKEGDGDALVMRNGGGCSVRNLRIVGDANAKSGSGLVYSNAGLTATDNCLIEGFPENGVYYEGQMTNQESSNTVNNCTFKNNRTAQIKFQYSNDFYILRNQMIVDDPAAKDACGIYMLLSSAGNITANYFSGCRVGFKLDKGSCMNRIEQNYFDDCTESGIDSGVYTPSDYDVIKTPREQLYIAWEWNKPHDYKMNTDTLICDNRFFASGKNPRFVALNARSTVFTTFYGNTVVAKDRIANVINAGTNCVTWIVTANSVYGNVEKAYAIENVRDIRIGGNVSAKSPKPMEYKAPRPTDLSLKLLKASSGQDVSGGNWFRKVSTAEELVKAISDIPTRGGTIYVTAGTYKIKNPLVIENKRNVTIIGTGMGSYLRALNDADLLSFKGDCRNCYVGNMYLTPDNADPKVVMQQKYGSAVHFNGTGKNFTVDCCDIDGWPISCIRIEGDPARPIENVNILANWITNGQQIQLYMKGIKGFHVSENQYGYATLVKIPVGACLEYCSDGIYEMNYHWNNRDGMQVTEGCENVIIRDNRMEQNHMCGLRMGVPGGEANRHFTIVGNTFHTNSELDPGLYSELYAMNTSDVKFIANHLYTWWLPRKFKNGVELDDSCQNWLFDGNYVRDNAERAVQCDPAGGHVFKLNYFDGPKWEEIR